MKICIPVREKNYKKAEKQVRKASKQADFIEIWFDHFRGVNLRNLIKTARKPVIAVCRGKKEKGGFRGTEAERIEVLAQALKAGARYVDLGFETAQQLRRELRKFCRKVGAKLIISHHFWNGTPSLKDLLRIFHKDQKGGADIVKIATFVKEWVDNVTLLELTARVAHVKGKIIALGMGEKGKISRIGCALLGGFLTYVALDKESRTANGQYTLEEYLKFTGSKVRS